MKVTFFEKTIVKPESGPDARTTENQGRRRDADGWRRASSLGHRLVLVGNLQFNVVF